MTHTEQQILFIGAGSMAEALIRGIVGSRLVSPSSVAAINRSNAGRLQELRAAYGIRIPETNDAEERRRLVAEADVVFLAMKPKDVGSALAAFADCIRPEQLIVSVLAGVSIGTLEQLIGRPQPIVRTMPNTSSTIGLGATGVAFSATVGAAQRENALALLQAVGITVTLDEGQIDLVTGISGSGPAYVYFLMEAMIQAGIDGGLSEENARSLVLQTVLGAANMVRTTGEEPSALRTKIMSPNGTTVAALQVLEEYKFPEALRHAVYRAAARSAELGSDLAASLLDRKSSEAE